MATKYWYITGSTANWNTAHWYPSSSGVGTATTLLAADDAILDTYSGTGSLNISAAATCNSFDATTYSGSLTGTFGLTLTTNISRGQDDLTPLFAFGAAMTQSYTGTTTFGGTAGGGHIYCNGQSFKGPVTFNSSGRTFTFKDTFRTLSTNLVTLTAGTIYATEADVEFGTFASTGTGIKELFSNNDPYPLSLTGTGSLYTLGLNSTNLTSTISNLIVSNATTSSKSLLYNNQFGSTNLYFSGSGPMVLIPGTLFKPNVYVDNVGLSASSFNISTAGTLTSLTFQPNTAVTWSNAAVVVTLEGNLTLTSSMAVTATPSLTFLGSGDVTFAGKSLTAGTVLTVNNGVYINFLDNYDNLGTTSILNSSTITARGFKTAGLLTLSEFAELNIPGEGFANGSGILAAPAVNFQTYSIGSSYLRASSNPVPTGSFNYYEFYFLTGSTAAQTAANLAGKIATSNTAFTATSNGAVLSISSSIPGTSYNGTTFATGSVLGEPSTTPLFTLGGGSATRRATGSITLSSAAVDSQRYEIKRLTTLYSYIASKTPLPVDDTFASALLYFSTGSTSSQTAANLASKINSYNPLSIVATSVGDELILSASQIGPEYNDITFRTGSIYGKRPDSLLITTSGATDTSPFSAGSINIGNSNLKVYATEATCSGTFTNSNPTNQSFIGGSNLYIGGATALSAASTTNWNTKNLYLNSTLSLTTAGYTEFNFPNNTVIKGTTTVNSTAAAGGITIQNSNVVFSNLTATNATLYSSTSPLICSGTLTFSAGDINFPGMYVGNLSAAGGTDRSITTPTIYFTGTGTLASLNSLVATNNLRQIYIDNNSSLSKTLTLTTTFPTNTNPDVYIIGSGSGTVNLAPGTTALPYVEVTNTGNADISISTGTLTGLTFTSGSNVNWNNVAGQTVTIGGNLLLTSSMSTQVTPNLSIFNSTALELADLELKTGSFGLSTTSSIYVTGSIKCNATVGITYANVTVSNYVSCSLLSLNSDAKISCSNNIYINSLSLGGNNRISAPELYVLGGSSLPTAGSSTDVISSFNTIHYLGNSNSARTITFTATFGAPILEIGGSGSGVITASLSTVYKPDVYVTNTGSSPISFLTSTLSSLSFISSSNVNWNNAAGQTLTISRSLELTSSMSTNATPNLLLSGSGFNSLLLADQDLRTGTLTINTTNPLTVSGNLTTNAAVTLTSSSLVVQNNFSSSGLVTINGGSRLIPSGTIFFAGSANITSGSIDLGRTTSNTVSQSLTLVTGSISASGDLSVGTLVTTGAAPKTLSTPNLSFTGTGLLYTTGTNFTIPSPLNSISITGSATTARGLILTDNRLTSSLIYLGGNGSGLITASFGTSSRPNVYVTNTGGASISLLTSTLSSLSFISSSTANWNNVAGQTITISGSLELTSSMSTNTTPNLILSGSGFNSLILANQDLRTGTLIIDTPNTFNISGSLISNAAVTIRSSSVFIQNNFSSSTLTLDNGSVTASNTISIGPLFVSGTLSKKLISDTLYYTGTGSLPFASATNLTSSMNTLFFDGSTNTARTITYDTQFKPSTIYIGGALSGSITASFGTSSIPTVYVDNTGRAPITFSSASISSLTFPSGSRANWNTSGSQTLTISGSLTLTGSMTASRTPNLVFNGNSTITMAGKNLSGSLISQAPFTQSFLDNFSSSGSVVVNGFLSASNITITRVDSLNVLGNCNISSSAIGTTTILGTGSVWSIPSTSTVNIPNNTIRIVNTTNNAVTFSGGNQIYGDLTFARGASTANNLISGSNTFINLRDTGTASHTMSLATGTTQTVGSFDVKGTPGNIVTVKSTTGIATLYKDPLGLVMCNFLSVNGVTATSGSGPWTWFAGPNSTLVNAAGWLTTGSEGVSIVRRLGSQGVG